MAKRENPPISGRFRKGQSGNLKGRPRAAREKQPSAFDIIIDRTLTVTQNGVPRELSVEEALHHRTYQDAIGGSRMAQREVFRMIVKREKALAAKGNGNVPHVVSQLEPVDPENADAALQILGIATRDAGRDGRGDKREPLLLEPWAVQAALDRRRGGERLGKKEVEEIRRYTRDVAKLRWPRGYEE
jgi:Family of unknown function (DUF5681)